MKIFLDFDDTIFNTNRFKRDYLRAFFAYGITEEEYNDALSADNDEIRGVLKRYDPEKQIRNLEANKGISLGALRDDIARFLKDLERYVFDDFYHFSRCFAREDLYLLSFGDRTFQESKVRGAKVNKYFSEVIITETSKGSELWKVLENAKHDGGEIAFIDDRPDQLMEVRREVKNIIPIRLVREEGRYRSLKSPRCCIECRSLLEAEKILNTQLT